MNDAGACRLPSAPKTRQLLALFVLYNNTPVSMAMCLEELWGNHGPRSAVQSLHTRIMHIRHALAASPSIGSHEGAKQALTTQHRGYQLHAAPGSVDLHHLERHVAESRRAEAAGDERRLRFALRAALQLWHGPALTDVELGSYLQARVTGLEELRLTLLDQRIEAELRLGMHHELLPELSQLAAEYPAHENFHAQYMLALYRSGRAAQALDAYHLLRGSLNQNLGIDPSPRLRGIHSAILNADPELTTPPSRGRALSLDLFSA
ncbi:AfsR/SARP family transcriptional regulator [Streptomyces sp. NBC_01304]|uniref:AfsR/SARP family transcriptional regulator n=1 Tax=Streptomyces sp. NBC_01304 TaxID=2903818 RepID=UPI002E0F39BB|nr:winged helix-turn-helix domain-containing protein [Streptomyces sp. NBC_01304]